MPSLCKRSKSTKRNAKPPTATGNSIADSLSAAWLQKNSRPTAFVKALDYACDEALEILHWGDKEITAEVYGSQPYTISLRLNKETLHADCTCPARHDWPGLCKYIVGLGVYVIDHRDEANDFPRLKDTLASALKKLPPTKLYALCLDLAFLNRNFRDRILNELGISFKSKRSWDAF